MDKYIKIKLRLLNDFGIYPNKEQLQHLYFLNTEVAIDNYVKSLINYNI